MRTFSSKHEETLFPLVLPGACDSHFHSLICLTTRFLFCSPQSVPDRLRIRVNKISLQDYEGFHYDKEKLREACKLEVPS